jgi:sugar-specific transcriptional regulator TrmB
LCFFLGFFFAACLVSHFKFFKLWLKTAIKTVMAYFAKIISSPKKHFHLLNPAKSLNPTLGHMTISFSLSIEADENKMSELDKTDLLMGLGLTPNQAKVYQTILKLGNVSASMISKSSLVRREDVYKVLPALEKMGLVEKLLGNPVMFWATPVAGALSSLIVDEKVKSDERIASMKAKFQVLSKAKWVLPIVLGEEESLYALIPEGKAVIAKLTSLITSSKINVCWIATLKEISHATSLLFAEIKGAIYNRVEIRVIIEDFKPDESQQKQVQHTINIDSAGIRFHHQPLNRFTVFDSREAMISTNRKNKSEDTSALWTTDTNLIGVLRGYFETAWSESEELK